MTNSVIITGILLILVAGASAVALGKLLFKKSIVFNIIAVLTLPILSAVIMGFIVGARGLIHLAWAAPLAIILIFGAYGIVAKMLQGPLNEMLNRVSSLAEGDVDILFSEKYQKAGNEMAQVIRMLVKLADSLKNIVSFTNHIGQGQLDTQYELLGEKDTLGKSMLEMRSNLQEADQEKRKRQQEDDRRNWVTVGLAKFAELLRANNDNIEELCNSIISNLVKYLGANQGGIFILNNDDSEHPILEMKACYAYERRKYINKIIEPGEGLVGTCYWERASIYMTAVPDDYIHITSGLGDGNPRALFIVPLKVNEEIYGVIELASFKEFGPHEREFVEKIAESIASTIGSVKINIQTNKLLAQSRLQAEEMANQEEELRQNMEEMQATQEEMRRRETEQSETLEQMKALQKISDDKEYETQQLYQSILKTFNAIEFSSDAIVDFVGKRVLEIADNAPESAFVGRTFYETYPGGEKEGKEIWSKLKNGEQVTAYTKLNGIPLKLEFLPVFNKQRQLQKTITLLVESDERIK